MAELFEIQAGGVVYDVIDAKALRKPLTEGTLGQIPANDGNGGTVWTDPQSGPGGSFNIHTLTQENNVEDNDEFVLYDLSALSHRKTLWSNIKALLKTYFDSIYATASALMGKQDLIDSSHKLSYNLLSGTPTIPDELADLTEDATHRTVTDTEKSTWNAKGTYSKPLGGIPESDLSQFLSDKINSRLVEIITLTETNGVISASLTFDEIAEYYSNGVMMFVKVGWRDEFRYFCTLEDVMFENLHCKKFTFSAMGSDHILFSYTVDRNNTWEYYEAELAKLDDVIERPGDAGEAGQVLMTDGDGGTSWATPYGNTFDIHALQNQNAIDDGDEIAIYDVSVDSNRKTTWSNIISKIQTALSSAFSGKADKVSGSHTNEIAILDSGGNLTAGGKTLNDLQDKIDASHKLSYNLLSDTPTIPAAPSDMTGATSGAAGAHGLVPAPSAGDDEKFLAGDGTWKAVQGGSANTPVVTTMPQAGMEAGKLYVMDYTSESAVTLLLQAGTSGVENVYRINFTTGATAPTITWPSGIIWCGGSAPTINASKTYEVNISDDGTHKLALACEY